MSKQETRRQGDRETNPHLISPPLLLPISLSPLLLVWALFLLFLAIYARTAAPSVLSGDSAEFQLAAPLLGVPHPTTYPLYILLGKLATLLVPFGDIAWRVTLVSVASAALAVALFFALARRVTGSAAAAAVAALALGFTPGLWNAATLAEVYALLAALLAGLGLLLADERRTTNDDQRSEGQHVTTQAHKSSIENVLTPSPSHLFTRSYTWRVRAAAFVAGLGCAHHGLFILTGLPLFVGYVLRLLLRRTEDDRRRTTIPVSRLPSLVSRLPSPVSHFKQLAILAFCFAAGLAPWLYPLIQYARYGPFDGVDYGLPRHYFWGAPQSWGAALDLLSGGTVRRGIFRLPSLAAAQATLGLVGARMWFEFGPLGLALGALGCAALLRRPLVWAAAAWVFLATLAYLLLLGPAVADAPVFTLPMLLPWALWIAAAVEVLLKIPWRAEDAKRRRGDELRLFASSPLRLFASGGLLSTALLIVLVAATLAWGYTRVQHSSKRRLWLYREFGQATLATLPPNAVVIAHWEQGMTLHYLRLVEGQRPDVWVDVVEPADEPWGARAQRRYAGRPVFFVGRPEDVASLPVVLVRPAEYADLFELRVSR